MNNTRRFSIRKFLRFLTTTAAVAGCAVALTAAAERQAARRIRAVDVQVANPRAAGFLDVASLKELLFERRHLAPTDLSLSAADIHRLERLAATNPWVSRAEVYVDNSRTLHVRVTQRVPVVRLFETDGTSYYLDRALHPVPLSPNYVHYAPAVTGVPPLRDDSSGMRKRAEIVGLVGRLMRDTFWSAQTAEVHMTSAGEYEIVPTLGAHRILLGDTTRLDQKLAGVLHFYKGVLNRIGWEKYTTLDARYRGQIVASPSLPWKAPVDKALTNMNWVNTIVGRSPERRDSSASASAAPNPVRATLPAVRSVSGPAPAPPRQAPEPAPRTRSRTPPSPARVERTPAAVRQPRPSAPRPAPAAPRPASGAAPKYVMPEAR